MCTHDCLPVPDPVDIPEHRPKPRRDRGSNVVEYALLTAMVAAALAASVLMYQAVTFGVGELDRPAPGVTQQTDRP
jgi:hypothetical protein